MSTPPPISDEDLAAQAAGGSRHAFEDLVQRYGGRVLALLERRLGDHHRALDLTQDAWVRVFRAMPRYDARRSFRSWLFAIALNSARDEQRRRGRSRVEFVDEIPSETQPSPAEQPGSESQRSIDAALEAVPEPYRSALILVDVEELAYEECAAALDIAVGTAKSRVSRGRRHFRDAYGRLEGTPNTGIRAEVQP